jgi:hypothetical protein
MGIKYVNFRITPEMAETLEKVKLKEQRSEASISRIALSEYCEKILGQEGVNNGLSK